MEVTYPDGTKDTVKVPVIQMVRKIQ
ncbi:hypothetical protein [Enterococcus faecium]